MTIQFDEDKQKKKIEELRKEEEEELVKILAEKYRVPYLDLSPIPINPDALRLIDEEKAKVGKLAIFGSVGKNLKIALSAPSREETKQILKELEERGYIPNLFLVSTQSLLKAWDRYKDITFATETKAGSLNISNEEINKILVEIKSFEDVRVLIQNILSQKKSYRVSKTMEIILAGAIAIGASDIHIEPEENFVRLRYRLDGVLSDILNFDKDTYQLLLSRIKLLSGMKLNIKDNAQDGRFSVSIDVADIEIRSSVIPGGYGESIVLRILNPKSISVQLEDLGIEPKLLKILEGEIKKPNGMILTTGPTGSGKTTTLYAFLRKIYNQEIKIITIEDPIEYHLKGITQTQVNSKKDYTFENGLRSVLRQDPDVIMVGEIRDREAAEIAINAALTGHLVFSTLHTNNASGTYPRLIDLGVNSRIISSAILISIAQRLVRKLCDKCKKEIPLKSDKKEIILNILKTIKDDDYNKTQTEKIWTAVGCMACNKTGYKGRIGIYEAILTNSKIENVIRDNPSEREISIAAEDQGILNMQQDGIIKVLKGITSVDELGRVVNLEVAPSVSETDSLSSPSPLYS